jgi:hypothetical protein
MMMKLFIHIQDTKRTIKLPQSYSKPHRAMPSTQQIQGQGKPSQSKPLSPTPTNPHPDPTNLYKPTLLILKSSGTVARWKYHRLDNLARARK